MEESALRLTDSIPVGTYTMVLPPGEQIAHFSFLSEPFLQITGLRREDVLSDPFKAFACVHPDDYPRWIKLNEEAFSRREAFFGETRILVHGQVRWVSAESTPRPTPDGGFIWEGVLTDITDRINAERQFQETQAAQARFEERSRLLEDMHDGFGSQLQSARLLIQSGQMSQSQLLQLIGECVDDLYLVVDLLSNQDQSLQDALVDYRHRMQYRTADLPCKMHWKFNLSGCPPLPERVILQLLRITQEAVTNAIKHAQANNITVSAVFDAQAGLTLSIADDGVGFSESVKSGRGLNNMKKRAQIIGGGLTIDSGPWPGKGTRITVALKR